MRQRLAMPEPAALPQRFFDSRVRVEHPLTAEKLDVVVEMPAWPDGSVDLEAVTQAGVEVVSPVARRRVDGARARVERDVLAQHADGVALVQRMPEADAFEIRALHLRDRPGEVSADDRSDRLHKQFGDDQPP